MRRENWFGALWGGAGHARPSKSSWDRIGASTELSLCCSRLRRRLPVDRSAPPPLPSAALLLLTLDIAETQLASSARMAGQQAELERRQATQNGSRRTSDVDVEFVRPSPFERLPTAAANACGLAAREHFFAAAREQREAHDRSHLARSHLRRTLDQSC